MFFLSCSYLTDTENGPLNCWIRTTTEQVSLGGHGSTHDLWFLGAYKWRWPMYKLTKNKHLLYINGCCSLSYTNEDWAALMQRAMYVSKGGEHIQCCTQNLYAMWYMYWQSQMFQIYNFITEPLREIHRK